MLVVADYIRSLVCVLLVSVLVVRYLKANREIVGLLFIAFALRYYAIPFIGPTIDVMYLFAVFVSCLELVGFLSGRIRLDKRLVALFGVPFVLFALFLGVYVFQSNQYLHEFNPVFWYIKTCANYLKNFGPYFMLGVAVWRNAGRIDLNETCFTIYNIAKVSCIVALIQLLCFTIFYQSDLFLEVIGLRGAHNYQFSLGSINLVRVQAFFYEPKSLAAFLGMSVPVAFYLGKKRSIFLFLLVGFLTVSQTFIVILLAAFILFILLKKVQSVRLAILFGVTIIIGVFLSISFLKDYLLEKYATQEETIAYKIFLDRALQRYSGDDSQESQELFGIPLQPDIELPAVNFLKDNKAFLLTGFGSGNYNTLPLKYFVSEWNIDALEQGTFKGHFDMGWIYLVAEFGAVFFLIVFFGLTEVKNTGFASRFYSFLWLVFFFHRIDFLLIAFFCLISYKSSTRESIDSDNFLQSGEIH